FGRSRFRITHHGEAGGAALARSRIVIAKMETAAPDDERRDRLLSTGRAQAADHSRLSRGAREISLSGRHSDEKSAGDARHRRSVRIGALSRGGGEPFGNNAGQ